MSQCALFCRKQPCSTGRSGARSSQTVADRTTNRTAGSPDKEDRRRKRVGPPNALAIELPCTNSNAASAVYVPTAPVTRPRPTRPVPRPTTTGQQAHKSLELAASATGANERRVRRSSTTPKATEIRTQSTSSPTVRRFVMSHILSGARTSVRICRESTLHLEPVEMV